MEKVVGRCDDVITLRGVNVFPTQIEEIVLRIPGMAPHFRVHLTRRDRTDLITVRTKTRPDAGGERRGAAAGAVTRAVEEGIETTTEVEAADLGTPERSVGGSQRVVDTRGK